MFSKLINPNFLIHKIDKKTQVEFRCHVMVTYGDKFDGDNKGPTSGQTRNLTGMS